MLDWLTQRAESDEGDARGLFSSDDAVARYVDRAETKGLFDQERKVVDRYFTTDGASVLDAGCGVGRVSNRLADRGFDVTGIDVSEPMVEAARSVFPDVEFRVGDVTDTDLPSAAFDYAVFSYFGLDYVHPEERRVAALRELHRLLKPGGILAFSSHNTWHTIPGALAGGLEYARDLYLTRKNLPRLFSRRKLQSVPLGELEIYLSSPLHQWVQLRRCGFTPLDVVGKRDGPLRYVEIQPYYVAKKSSG